jgi:hypothetical protein
MNIRFFCCPVSFEYSYFLTSLNVQWIKIKTRSLKVNCSELNLNDHDDGRRSLVYVKSISFLFCICSVQDNRGKSWRRKIERGKQDKPKVAIKSTGCIKTSMTTYTVSYGHKQSKVFLKNRINFWFMSTWNKSYIHFYISISIKR